MKTRMSMGMMCLGAALALATVPGHAAVEFNQDTDLSFSIFVPCAAGGAGEVVDLSGPLHTLITFTVNGNNVSGDMHFQPQGISGVGETTGDKYQATGITRSSFAVSLQNGQANSTFVNNFRIIGQGPGNNFLVHETAHITFNANGTVTAFFDDFRFDCK